MAAAARMVRETTAEPRVSAIVDRKGAVGKKARRDGGVGEKGLGWARSEMSGWLTYLSVKGGMAIWFRAFERRPDAGPCSPTTQKP